MKDKLTIGGVIGAIVLSLLALFGIRNGTVATPNTPSFGAAGSMLAENYLPYIFSNGGFSTAKDLTLSSSTNFNQGGLTFFKSISSLIS